MIRLLAAATSWRSPCSARLRPHLLRRRKINLSKVLVGQNVGVKKITDHIWLVSFMTYDLGFFDNESCRVECAPNPFGAKVLPMSPE